MDVGIAHLARPLVRIAIALSATGGACLARWGLSLFLGDRFVLLPFLPAVMVSAAYGGLWAGILCTLLSAGLVGFFWLEPSARFAIEDIGEALALAIFVALGIAISSVQETLRRERGKLELATSEARQEAAAAKRAHREAEVANRAKDLFLSVLSHELRTPLTAILGWVSLLRTGKLDTPKRAHAIETIERNAKAQAQLIDDMLDVSRIITGKLALHAVPMDPAVVLAAALEVVRPSADAKGIALVESINPEVGRMGGDPTRLQQIAWNLLSNAIKFTPRGGRVTVRLDRDAGDLRLSVDDTGQGIEPAFLPHLFERFRQADPSSTRAYAGLGLGLSIVKHLVELHGGTVTAESEGVGMGATFTVRLPMDVIEFTEEQETHELRRDRDDGAMLDGLRVLVVDDDADTREIVGLVLSNLGARVDLAASARDAMRTLETSPVDVLVCDIAMPGEDGYSLLGKANAMFASRELRVPVLALTAYAGPEDVKRTRRAGFAAHLAKPVVPGELVRTIARLARSAGAPGATTSGTHDHPPPSSDRTSPRTSRDGAASGPKPRACLKTRPSR